LLVSVTWSWATARSRRNTLEPPEERVIAAVQRPHRSRQWFTILGRRQRIPVGTHQDPRAAVAAHPKTGRTVAADRAHPHLAVVGLRPAHDLRLEPSQFLGMQARIHQQP
jgi:hypothetical protein